jgi:arginase
MKDIKILGIPFDYGQDHLGVRLGVDFLRSHGLLKRLREYFPVQDLGDLIFENKHDCFQHEKIKYFSQASSGNKSISSYIEKLNLKDSFLLNLGGDHGMSLGSIHGILSHNPETIIFWLDAHGDLNSPESSPSGNFHGMPLHFLLNHSQNKNFLWIKNNLKPHKLVLLGARDLDPEEKKLIQDLGIIYYSSSEINEWGAESIMHLVLKNLDPKGQFPIHLSFDVDFIDEQNFISTGTKVKNGPKLEEVFLLVCLLAETQRLKSMDLVEFNPLIGSPEDIYHSASLILDLLEMTIKQMKKSQIHHPEVIFTPQKNLNFSQSHQAS